MILKVMAAGMGALLLGISISSCNSKPKSSLKAIHLANKSLSLLPGRLYAPSGSGVAYENSIRMMMLPIGCSPSQIRKLEELVAKDVEAIRHVADKVVGVNGQPIPGAESCTIITKNALHPWAYQKLFETPAKTQNDYLNQQWLWLAIRGRTTGQSSGFTVGFDQWMAEAGVYRSLPMALVDRRISQWDTLYNPCVKGNSADNFGFNKNDGFSCVDGDYEPKNDKLGSRILTLIDQTSINLVTAIKAGEFSQHDTTGLEAAIVVTAGAKASSGQSGFQLANNRGGFLRNLFSVFMPMRGSSYQGYGPTQHQGYAAFAPMRRPPPQRSRVTQQPSTRTPSNSQQPTNTTGQTSVVVGSGEATLQQDVTDQFGGADYGQGKGYKTYRFTEAASGKQQFVDIFPNGKRQWWEKDAAGGWKQLKNTPEMNSYSPDYSIQNGRLGQDFADGSKAVDVTKEMRSRYGDIYDSDNTTTTMVVRKDGTRTYRDHNSKTGEDRWYSMNDDNTWTPLLAFDKNGKQIPIPKAGKSDSVQGTARTNDFIASIEDNSDESRQGRGEWDNAAQQVFNEDDSDEARNGRGESGDGPAGSASEETPSPGADPGSRATEAGEGPGGSASSVEPDTTDTSTDGLYPTGD